MLTIDPNPRVTFGIRFQDDHLLVVEKPARVPTQPGKGHQSDTLLNGLFARFGNQLQNLGKARDFGLLHRLDRETSGLLIIALRPASYDSIRRSFEARRIRKFYWAICDGQPRDSSGVIKLAIAESDRQEGGGPQKLAHISRTGKPAITAYRVLSRGDSASLIEARPITGRLHQVRVHLDAIGCPILGDDFYGPRKVQGASPRLALHAHRIQFPHPVSGQPVDVRSEWPKDLKRLVKSLRLAPDEASDAPVPADDPELADVADLPGSAADVPDET